MYLPYLRCYQESTTINRKIAFMTFLILLLLPIYSCEYIIVQNTDDNNNNDHNQIKKTDHQNINIKNHNDDDDDYNNNINILDQSEEKHIEKKMVCFSHPQWLVKLSDGDVVIYTTGWILIISMSLCVAIYISKNVLDCVS